MDWNEEAPRKPPVYALGADLSGFSVEELQSYIAMLETEKARVQAMLESKKASLDAAASFFKN